MKIELKLLSIFLYFVHLLLQIQNKSLQQPYFVALKTMLGREVTKFSQYNILLASMTFNAT